MPRQYNAFRRLAISVDIRTGESATAATGAKDLKLVIEWLKANMSPYGGDPGTIVVVHSEGARLAARYLFNVAAQPEAGHGVAATVLSLWLFGNAAPDLAGLVDEYDGEPMFSFWSGID